MAETKKIASISIIIDSETSYDKIGDVEGGFDELELKQHIEKYGHQALCEKLTAMNWQIWNAVREINSQNQQNTQTEQNWSDAFAKNELCPICEKNTLINDVCHECTDILCKPISEK